MFLMISGLLVMSQTGKDNVTIERKLKTSRHRQIPRPRFNYPLFEVTDLAFRDNECSHENFGSLKIKSVETRPLKGAYGSLNPSCDVGLPCTDVVIGTAWREQT